MIGKLFQRARLAVALGVLCVVATCATGCSGQLANNKKSTPVDFADQDFATVHAEVAKDMSLVSSVRVAGTVAADTFVVDVDLSVNAAGLCAGTLAIGKGQANIIVTASGRFMRGDKKFWKKVVGSKEGGKRVFSLLGDKWGKLPPGQGGFSRLCDLTQVLGPLAAAPREGESGSVGEEVVVDGVPTLELVAADGSRGWVRVEDPHYLVKTAGGAKASGEAVAEPVADGLILSAFDIPVVATEPLARDVIDLSRV